MSQSITQVLPTRPQSITALLSARYLLVYNLAMTAGWTVILLRLVQAITQSQSSYGAVIVPLKIFQSGAILEILHSLTGLIRAPASTTALQVASRLLLLWGVVDPVENVREKLSVSTMVLAWALTEIPRYFYFSISAVSNLVPYWVVFMRYTTFIPLYPMGAFSEWYTLLSALPYIREMALYSVNMPNHLNFAFDYYTFSVIVLAFYIPGLPFMFSHMVKQRRKYLSKAARKVHKEE